MGEVTTKALALRLNLYNYESHIVDRGMGLGCGCIVDHNNNFELNKDPQWLVITIFGRGLCLSVNRG